jgi:hypothetical protein
MYIFKGITYDNRKKDIMSSKSGPGNYVHTHTHTNEKVGEYPVTTGKWAVNVTLAW